MLELLVLLEVSSTYTHVHTHILTHIQNVQYCFERILSCYHLAECTNGEVRLVGGMVPSEGRVEVCLKGVWGTISDDGFTTHESAVVCKQLGYYPNCKLALCCSYTTIFTLFAVNADAYTLTNAFFGQGSGVIQMDSVECT